MMFLPEGCQKKYLIISDIYFQDGDYDYSKSREIEKITKSCLSVSLRLSFNQS